ncbi:MAG: BatA domain-containing protein [Planctomycetota bacterium]|nr:BatA domain-containing protein [Planctomycetota bacterium]
MTFTWPFWFWAMSLVAAAALWAMFRPSRKHVVVASLSLWQEALAATPLAGRRARRISWSWLLLLAGAVAGVTALAGPVVRPEAAARRVAIALRPSAELGGPAGLGELRHAVGALLDRLSGNDRVQLLLPAAAGGGGQWVSPAQAREALQRPAILCPTPRPTRSTRGSSRPPGQPTPPGLTSLSCHCRPICRR